MHKIFANMNMLLAKSRYFKVWLCESVVCMETAAVCIVNCCNCLSEQGGVDYGVRIWGGSVESAAGL